MGLIKSILIHYGEIGLKGKNRPQFIKQLKDNVQSKLSTGLPPKSFKVVKRYHAYLLVENLEAAGENLQNLIDLLKEIFGIAWLAPVYQLDYKLPANLDQLNLGVLKQALIKIAKQALKKDQSVKSSDRTFSVKVNRADKRFPIKSPELAKILGTTILRETAWQQVNFKSPKQTFFVDINPDRIFLFTEKIKGLGGLPVGVSGRVIALLSGGIDSPVASFLAAKRGLEVDFIHLTATKLQQTEVEKHKVARLAQLLSKYTLRSRLYLAPYTHFYLALTNRETQYELILFRRFMARLAAKLASQTGAGAIVTGDNLAQVASQTLSNLATTSQAIKLPILQPLLTYDKQKIIDLAKQLGTYETSLEPYKDCCSLIERHPKTRSENYQLELLEKKLFPNYQMMIDQTLDDIIVLKYHNGKIITT